MSAILAYLFTPWGTFLLEKLTGLQLVDKFPAFFDTRKFIVAFTVARHLSLSWASSIQSISLHPTSWRSILILSSHLRLDLASGFSLGFPHQNHVYGSPLPHKRYMPRPSHSSRFYHPYDIGWGVDVIRLHIIYYSPIFSYPIPLRTKYSSS